MEKTSEAAPEAVRQVVGGGYYRLQMPSGLAVAGRETVARHRLGALEGGGGGPRPRPTHPWVWSLYKPWKMSGSFSSLSVPSLMSCPMATRSGTRGAQSVFFSRKSHRATGLLAAA